MTNAQRVSIEALLIEGQLSRDEIAAQVGVPPATVSAIKAYVAMRRRSVAAADPLIDLPRVAVSRKTGDESFLHNGRPISPLVDFWRWSDSDLLSNAVRGRIAEYLVALDLGVAQGTRSEWVAFDLQTSDGVAVEVKSASYIQTWAQRRDSAITFDIRKTVAWNADTATFDNVRRRQAQAYVFALIEHRDRASVDPLNVDQWLFHVLATSILDAKLADQKSLSLAGLLQLQPTVVRFGGIGDAVKTVVAAGLPARA